MQVQYGFWDIFSAVVSTIALFVSIRAIRSEVVERIKLSVRTAIDNNKKSKDYLYIDVYNRGKIQVTYDSVFVCYKKKLYEISYSWSHRDFVMDERIGHKFPESNPTIAPNTKETITFSMTNIAQTIGCHKPFRVRFIIKTEGNRSHHSRWQRIEPVNDPQEYQQR